MVPDERPFRVRDLKVLDLTTMVPGSYATMVLADLGAEVSKIEPPGRGDPLRDVAPGAFQMLNRGKRGAQLDLRSPAGRAAVLAMARTADVFIENFRPGALDRLGLGYAAVAAQNPRIVYCSITGFGQTGPRAADAGHEGQFLALGGGLSTPADFDVPIGVPALPVAGLAAGTMAATVVLANVIDARAQGLGVFIDLSIVDVVSSWATARLGAVLWDGSPAEVRFSAFNRIYRCADGGLVSVGAVEDRYFVRFCQATGLDDLVTDRRLADLDGRLRHSARILDRVAAVLAAKPLAQWVAAFQSHGVPHAPVLGPEEVYDSDHAHHRGLVQDLVEPDTGTSRRLYGLPAKVSGRDPRIGTLAPGLGEHSAAILRGYGLDETTIEHATATATTATERS